MKFAHRLTRQFLPLLIVLCMSVRAFGFPIEAHPPLTTPSADVATMTSMETGTDHNASPCTDHDSETKTQKSCQIDCGLAGAPMLLPATPLIANMNGDAHDPEHPTLLFGITPPLDLRPPIA